MPTFEHNALIDIFRENPELAPRILSTVFHMDIPPHTSTRVADSSLDQLIPVEFRADLVLELIDDKGKPVLAVVLEAQREQKPRKKFTWPVYGAVARAERECPAIVTVIAPDPDVSAWAAEKIDLGFGLGTLEPVVLGPPTLPVITDPAEAEKDVELALLSAVAHGNGPQGLDVVQAAVLGMKNLDAEHAAVYFFVIWKMLREPMQRALEALVMQRQTEGKVQFPPFAQVIFEQGIEKGKLEGELEGERKVLLRLLARVGIALTDDERARILGCTDPAMLDRWIDNVLGAKTASDVLS